ncbi:FAD-dependent thymidylate synthase [Laspinema sp. D1]|uniref:FAD-dependent thymidylate synthase n=1 Tax=Laspinema palackyanum D2a TaxID=2953684 RepID=A0ABT2MK78_9CYAN|nr:FAD-dependent thymidylate synthase [Laspinema sp. D2a]
MYRVTLEDGKTIKCTQNHKILTPYGWRILAQLSIGSEVMVNGQSLESADKIYQDKEWLKTHFDKGLRPKDIAAIAGCSTESIKKWAYRHNLSWDKSVWNKGIQYNINLSDEERERRRQHIEAVTKSRIANGSIASGENHPSWKGLPIEKRAYNWLKYHRGEIIAQKGGKCQSCGALNKLHCHHIKPISDYPELAFEFSNFEVLCASCHVRHHKKGVKNPLCAHPKKIIAIEYVGVEPTYDLVMQAPNHNFVADGIVVHNSGRYSGRRIIEAAKGLKDIEEVFYLRPVDYYTDRQGKAYLYTPEQRKQDLDWCMEAAKRYQVLIEQGYSEEQARGIIPFDIRQNFIISFNARSFMHILDLRAKPNAQLECQEFCELIWVHFREWVPAIAAWYKKNRLGKGRLAP